MFTLEIPLILLPYIFLPKKWAERYWWFMMIMMTVIALRLVIAYQQADHEALPVFFSAIGFIFEKIWDILKICF